MIDDEILEILQDAAGDAVATSIFTNLPIKYIGRTWVVPDDQKWLELVFIPNNENAAWGDETNYRGMFRLILHWPNNDAGALTPLGVLRSIADYFSKDRWLQKVKISDTPKLTGVLEEGSEMMFPASIRYQCFQ